MSEQGKTLVILTPAFPTEEQDNWLPSQSAFVRTLNEIFPQLEIIILVFHFPVVRNKRSYWYGNKVVSFNGGMKGKLHTLWRWTSAWRELNRIRKQHDLLGIFSFFCSESAFIGHHFAKRHKLKHFIWVLGQDARKDNKQVRRIKPRANELIAISDFLVREFHVSHGIKPGHMIPIGVNPESFSLNNPQRTIDILGAGTLSPIKQYDLFIVMVKEMARSIPGITALICGDGSEYDALRQQIDTLELQDTLHLTRGKSHQDMLHTMQQSKVLLHTSSYEGFGMVCAEALCAGAHVISFTRPLDTGIEHWHIVNSPEEMMAKAIELLQDEGTPYFSIVPHRIQDTAIRIMRLFGYGEAVAMEGSFSGDKI